MRSFGDSKPDCGVTHAPIDHNTHTADAAAAAAGDRQSRARRARARRRAELDRGNNRERNRLADGRRQPLPARVGRLPGRDGLRERECAPHSSRDDERMERVGARARRPLLSSRRLRRPERRVRLARHRPAELHAGRHVDRGSRCVGSRGQLDGPARARRRADARDPVNRRASRRTASHG